jgi:flavin reductase (DIM6/NTAB) family NADH-FMN oxidoreductase RutF
VARIDVNCDAFFPQLARSLQEGGALLVSNDETGKPNVMTIGWAQLGVIWGKWVMTVLVRPSRYTYGCCNHTGDFTVNVPYAEQGDEVLLCGTRSGRDTDKFAACGFTATPPHSASMASPYIAECGLVFECRTVLTAEMDPALLATEICGGCYPQGDYHRMYYGEVLGSHADPDFAQKFGA